MSSVTQIVKNTNQPYGGFLPAKKFKVIALDDGHTLSEAESLLPQTMGLVVDYMTRYLLTRDFEQAFDISLKGIDLLQIPRLITAEEFAKLALCNQIKVACELVVFDQVVRAGLTPTSDQFNREVSQDTLRHLEIMIQRSLSFFKTYGPLLSTELTFQGGYNQFVTSGDGDFLTEDTIWDFKVSKHDITKRHTLQLLMYWILGQESGLSQYQNVKNIGIFNPRLNKVYYYHINDLDQKMLDYIKYQIMHYDG